MADILLGTIVFDGFSERFDSILAPGNPRDNVFFTTPVTGAIEGEAVFGAFVNNLTTTGNVPLKVTVYRDLGTIGSVDRNDVVGQTFEIVPVGGISTSLSNQAFDLFDSNTYFQPGENYYVSLERSTAAAATDVVTYGADAILRGGIVGEISATSDDSYSCNTGTFYHDDYTADPLTGEIIRVGEGGADPYVVGQEIELTVLAQDFNPVLFLFNVDNGEILQSFNTIEETFIGGQRYNEVSDSFFLEAGITYGVSVETGAAGQTGDYLLTGSGF